MSKSNLALAFVGDMSFGDSLFCQGFGVRSVVRQTGADYLFSGVGDTLSSNDILFGNLEVILSRKGENPGLLQSVDMRGDPECVTALKKTGFTLLNVANNHSMQHGREAFNETLHLLQSNGIYQLGLKAQKNDWHSQPVIIEKKGMKIGFLGYAFEADRYSQKPLYCYGQDEAIEEDITKLKKNVDFLILSVHWGLEYINRPSILTIRRAHRFIDVGADTIIGHHPHVLQGIEVYKGKIIAYSLGNFIFDMNWSMACRESVILKLVIKDKNKISYELIPVFIDKYYRPVLLADKGSVELLKKIDNLSHLIQREVEGDFEKKALLYYTDVEKKIKQHRYLSYVYFLKFLHKYKKKFLVQQFIMTIKSRIEDLRR